MQLTVVLHFSDMLSLLTLTMVVGSVIGQGQFRPDYSDLPGRYCERRGTVRGKDTSVNMCAEFMPILLRPHISLPALMYVHQRGLLLYVRLVNKI